MSSSPLSDSFAERFELFFATATVGAHANASKDGFRQRDVRFLVELFSNWVESSLGAFSIPVKNTQVLRYLESLENEGFARKISRKGRPTYRLTRLGLIELLTRIVERNYLPTKEQFFFLYYFIRNYKPRLEELVIAEGKEFPPSVRIELGTLLDERQLVERELTRAKTELEKLEIRIRDSKATSNLAKKLESSGLPLASIVEDVEKQFPYELNSQKPLTELIESIPEEVRLWELTQGNAQRVSQLWGSSKKILCSYISELEKLMAID